MLLVISVNTLKDDDFNLVDPEDDQATPDMVKTEHLTPDINCLINNHPELFGFPEKQINASVEAKSINPIIDPFMVYIDSIMEKKEENVDLVISISDINSFYMIDDDDHLELRLFLDDCSHIPKKFGLELLELNYLYCAIIWKNAFENFNTKLLNDKGFKSGFLKIIDSTVSEIFNYKTYIRNLTITQFTRTYWTSFYKNLLEYNDISANFKDYDETTIIQIKEKNFFFNREKFMDLNMFFKFYTNYEEILISLNKSFFYFYVSDDMILMKIKKMCDTFENIIVKELYTSNFYLLMRSDQLFIDTISEYAIHHNSLVSSLEDEFVGITTEIEEYILEEIKKEQEFDLSAALSEKPIEEKPMPSDNPLLNQDSEKYHGVGRSDVNIGRELTHGKIVHYKTMAEVKEQVDKAELDAENSRAFLGQFKMLGDPHREIHFKDRYLEQVYIPNSDVNKEDGEPNPPHERKLKQVNRTRKPSDLRRRNNEISDKDEKEFYSQLKLITKPKKKKRKRTLLEFKLPEQPNISDPKDFFERIDLIKQPPAIKVRRMTLTEFFAHYEERVKDYYGAFANVHLISLCKSHMHVHIEAFANIFCMILQRETSLLLQQKYNNTKVRAFVDKYFRFITYNFFTYFKIIEEKDIQIETSALFFFYAEKYFGAVKLAIVSFNNLLLHFEEEYKEFYNNKLRDIFMPLLNRFKLKMIHIFYKYEDEFTQERLDAIDVTEDELRYKLLPNFRKDYEELILKPTLERVNLHALEEQYKIYMEGMNLLSYDKIKENFLYYSKKVGTQTSSEAPPSDCMMLQIADINQAHVNVKKGVNEEEVEIDSDGDEKCIRNWKLYDDMFHYVFYNVEDNTMSIKSKTKVGSPSQHNMIMAAVENELNRVVNGFIAPRMKEVLDNFYGSTKADFETCGMMQEYSMIKCFSIFGNNNCKHVPNTIYYSRKCPKGFVTNGLSCDFSCKPHNLTNNGEFCEKPPDSLDLPCPAGTVAKNDNLCLKPVKRYFLWVMNPFNNRL